MKVFMYGLLAVGMRHYGSNELNVGEVYYLRRDIDNPYDGNAVAIVDHSGRKKASLKRDAAAVVAGLFDNANIRIRLNMIVLKPKSPASYHSPRIGMAQRCNVGFCCSEEDMYLIESDFRESRVRYRFEYFFDNVCPPINKINKLQRKQK